MSQETPGSALEKKENQPSYPFVEQSESVRAALGIEENADRWKLMMSTVTEDIAKPESGLKHSEHVHIELDRRYRLISTKREIVARAFLAVVAKVNAKMPLSDVEQRAILRHFAQFIDQKDSYEHMLQGTVPTGTELPEYMAPYVVTKENVQFAIRASEMLLPMQYDVTERAGITESPKILAPLAYPIMMDAAKVQMSMSVITGLLDDNNNPISDPEVYKTMLKNLGYKEIDDRSIEAATLFVGYLGKHMDTIRQHAEISPSAKGSVELLTVPQALECCVNLSGLAKITAEIALRAPDLLQKGLPDLRQFATEIFENDDLYPERMVQLAMKPISDLGENPTQDQQEEYQKDVKAVMEFFLRGNSKFEANRAPVRGRERYIQTLNAKQKVLVESLCKKVCSEETLQKLLRASFIPKEKKDRPFDIQDEAEEKLRELILNEQITMREAFELHYLMSVGESANISLAYKAVAILDKHGYSNIARELQFSIFKAVTDIALSDADELSEKLTGYDLNEDQQRELRNVREYLKESGIDALEGFMSQMYLFVKFYPEIAWPLIIINSSGLTVGTVILARKGMRSIQLGGFETFAKLGPEAARANYNIPRSVTRSRIVACQEEMKKLLSTYDRLSIRLHSPVAGYKSLKDMKLLLRSAKAGELGEIASALRRVYPHVHDLAAQLSQVASSEAHLTRALTNAGYGTEEVREAIRYLARNEITIGGGFGPEALSSAARIQERIGAFLSSVSNNTLLDQLARNPTNAGLRTKAARKILGRRFLLPSAKKAILAAHKAEGLSAKRRILRGVFKNSDDISLLMRAGICGDTEKAMANFVSVGASPATAADEVVSSFANVGAQSADDVLIKAGSAASRPATAAEKQLLQRWWNSPAFKEILHYGGVALQGYVVYSDLMALKQAEKHYQSAQENAKKHLDGLVAMPDSGWILEGDTYKYKDKVSIRLDQIGSDTGTDAANWRLATDAAALGIMISMGAKAFAGPPGWILIGAQVVIHTAVSAWETSEYYAFVKHVDPALLAYLGGTAATIGPDEYRVLEDKLIDIFPLGKDIEVRKRAVFSWFMTHTACTNPSAYTEIVGMNSYEGMGQFFEKDFQKHILPNVQTHLMLNARLATLDMDFLTKLDMTDFFNVISRADMEKAFKESANWYVNHIREQRYIDTLALYEKEEDPLMKSMLASQVYELGSKHVFGKRLMDQKEELLKNGGQSRMSLMATNMRSRLIASSGRGTWLDAMNNQNRGNGYVFRHIERKKETSYARDFTFDISDIAGVGSDKEYIGRLWYSDMLSRASTPDVPKVNAAVPDVGNLPVPKFYTSLHSGQSEILAARSMLLNQQERLERLNRYIKQLSYAEDFKSQRMALLPEQNSIKVALETVYKDRKESSYRDFGVATEKQLLKKYNDLCTRTSALYKKQLDEQAKLADLVRTEFSGYPEVQEYGDLSLPELTTRYGTELASYLLDLQAAEEFSGHFVGEYAHLTEVTRSTNADRTQANIETSFTSPELTASLYPERNDTPTILYSGDISEEQSAIEVAHLQIFAQYPFLDTTRNEFDTLHPSHLLSIHIYQNKTANGDIEYSAMYLFSKNQDDPRPQEEDIVYVQLGGKAEGGSGHLELGLPVQVFSQEFSFRNKSVYFESGLSALRENQLQNTKEVLRGATRSERLFRAGDIMNDLVQVSRTEWAVRFHEKGKHVFYLIRVNPDGSTQSKKLEYTDAKESIQENVLRYLAREEAYKKTGSMEVREYTQAEQGFGKQIEQDLQKQEWGAVPAELVKKFKLDTGDPSQFINAIPLPFEQAAGGNEFGGVDGIVDKLGLRSVGPGQPGLDEATIARVKGVIEMMHSKLDQQFGAESGAYHGQFQIAFDKLMSIKSQEIFTATPSLQREMIKNIMLEAARRVDQRMPQGGTAAQQSLIDATESADFGAY